MISGGCSSFLYFKLYFHLSSSIIACFIQCLLISTSTPSPIFISYSHFCPALFSAYISLLLSSHLELGKVPLLLWTFLLYVSFMQQWLSAGRTKPNWPAQRERPEALKPVILSSPLSGMCGEWREIWNLCCCNFSLYNGVGQWR